MAPVGARLFAGGRAVDENAIDNERLERLTFRHVYPALSILLDDLGTDG
jgi:hypothetical protein